MFGISMTKVEVVDRLKEIQDEIGQLVSEASEIIRTNAPNSYSRADSYFIPEIRMALDNEHGYLGRCMCTLQDVIDEIENPEVDDDESYEPEMAESLKDVVDKQKKAESEIPEVIKSLLSDKKEGDK